MAKNFVMTFIGIVFVLLIPLLIIGNFRAVPSGIQAIYCIFMISLSLLLTVRILRWGKRAGRRDM